MPCNHVQWTQPKLQDFLIHTQLAAEPEVVVGQLLVGLKLSLKLQKCQNPRRIGFVVGCAHCNQRSVWQPAVSTSMLTQIESMWQKQYVVDDKPKLRLPRMIKLCNLPSWSHLVRKGAPLGSQQQTWVSLAEGSVQAIKASWDSQAGRWRRCPWVPVRVRHVPVSFPFMATGCGSGNSVLLLLLPQCTAPLQFDPSSTDRKLCTLEMHREEAEDHTSFQPEGYTDVR